jgi:alcohol dehydrogenase
MKALVFDGTLQLTSEYPPPVRKPGESLIRVTCCGICNTDLEISKGYMNFRGALGHEFVGIVEESDEARLRGKRVVGEINLACGQCALCRSGMRSHCPNRSVLGILNHPGAMAEYVALPDVNLHEVPPSVSDEEAVFCEPLAAAFEILTQIPIRPYHKALVLGDGKLGLLVAQVLKTTGAKAQMIGHSRKKLALARRLSIDVLEEEAEPNSADIVVDCTGSPDGLASAIRLVKPRGTIVLKTTVADRYHVDLAPLVINEIMVIGSRCGPFRPALKALEERTVCVKELITDVFPLEQGREAFQRACEPDVLKVLIKL